MRFKIFIILSIFFSLFLFCPAFATDYGLSATMKATGGLLPPAIQGASTLPELAGVIVNVVLSLVGILFFILMLYAGIIWMKAMGSSEDVTKAKDMITQAIIGLVIVMAAYAISNFIFTSLGATGGGSSGGGSSGATVVDGSVCSDPSGAKGYKWNCRGGAGTTGKPCSADAAFCDSPCRYNSSQSTCMAQTDCSAHAGPPPWTSGTASDCPGSAAGTVCCLTDVKQDK